MSPTKLSLIHDQTRTEVRSAIVVIGPHLLMRNCLVSVFQKEFAAFDVTEAASACEPERLDDRNVRLVLLHIGGQTVADAAVLRSLTLIEHAFPEAPVALVAERNDDAAVAAAIRQGIVGYIPVSLPLEIAIAALRLVLVGGTYFPQPVTPCGARQEPAPVTSGDLVTRGETADEAPGPVPETDADDAVTTPDGGEAADSGGFTPREAQVLAALQRGRPNKLIANELSLSENTVKVHIRHIMRKLRATNRTEAVLIAQRQIPAPRLAYSA